ncbi:hypothetical protein LC048_11900 [Mesobacillus subterraneus]|uniref:hypothetical protein n=1 Tax=Mesobacillus subterraneus TaxID=285983 RepID=UPI001CFE34FB|nr:hypothetical protein [Mesobacillus subterraneus]WLR57489.1 hypothetical protein LC048_11900 [Mesobacillus subterraneus]
MQNEKKLVTFSLAVILLAAGLTTFPTSSHACKCVKEKSVEKELESSKAVFSGKVIDIKNKNNKRKILFEVEDTWKDVSQTEIILEDEWSSCSIDFFKGESYLVYAYEFQGQLTTNICDRTKELSSAGEDFVTLGKGSAPTEEVDLQKQLQSPVVRYIYIWIPLVSLMIVSIIFIRKRSGN